MKTRFSTLDIIAILPELKAKICTGWRVNQVYDCDQNTYLFKLNKSIVKMKKDDDPVSVDEETSNKMSLIIESGLRIHTTDNDWPKSHAPSYFAGKLRKSIKNKRIENISQIGIDRAVDIQFGSNLVANHLIIELYDKGNMVLTDNNYEILALLRWRKPNKDKVQDEKIDQNDSENFRIGEKYPLHLARKKEDLMIMTEDKIVEMLQNSRILTGSGHDYKRRNKAKQEPDDGSLDINLKDLLNPYVCFGSSLLEDRLIEHVFNNRKITKCCIKIERDSSGRLNREQLRDYAKLIKAALNDAERILIDVSTRQKCPGFVLQKRQDSKITETDAAKRTSKQNCLSNESKAHFTNIDFFPIRSCAERKLEQDTVSNISIEEFDSFDKAVDVYYSNLESQKIDSQALSAEREAMKKLGNLKIAQEKRLDDLARAQKEDEERGRLIELNCDKVENALLIIRSMLANQIPWSDIWNTIREAQSMNDPIASLITGVRFDRNEFYMKLCDPYDDCDEDAQQDRDHLRVDTDEGTYKNKKKNKKTKNQNDNSNDNQSSKYKNVEIDISLSAHANARKFFTKRRTAVNKEKKTVEVAKKALKNVERQTKERLKEVKVKTNIIKARKRYWFENFFWFISSDGYLVVAGRDSEQNELLVKRYMKTNDIYVHADLHGASSVIVKNESTDPVPPKTLTEAGSMAVCYSSAWDSKIATTSWWVYPNQVSKTAPAGEYLTQGAFVIRGKKNYLPLSNLVLGFGLLFRLGDESIERRVNERSREQNNSDECQGRESQKTESNNDEEDSDEDDVTNTTKHRLLDALTESPSTDDVLLYCIPVCGPYSAFRDYKYKVKVVPGANKRGKAAKTCLTMFLHDKRASQREKDLLRAIKDQDYARNVPNNVKISVRLPQHATSRPLLGGEK